MVCKNSNTKKTSSDQNMTIITGNQRDQNRAIYSKTQNLYSLIESIVSISLLFLTDSKVSNR